MKILDLKLQAFGPFLKEQHISFENLNDKGMFLINGPTGTGKTSIFDAIVYALYGQGSGNDRDNGRSLRSDFAKDEDVTYVELTFEANQKIYKILRKGEYYRKKAKGEGLTKVSGAVELTMPDGNIISGDKAVEEKILNEILFINIKQFKNIALLAQGEFTELVTAKTPDRAKILEHIFQKEIYDDFQAKLTEMSKKAEKEKDSIISSINTLIMQVEDGDQILGYKEAINEPSNIPTYVVNLEEQLNKLNENKSVQENIVNELKQVYEDSRLKLESLKKDNEQISKYLKAIEELEQLSSRKEGIENFKKQIAIQLEIDSLNPFISQKDQLEKELKSIKATIDGLEVMAKEITSDNDWLKEKLEEYNKANEQIASLDKTLQVLAQLINQIAGLIKEKRENLHKEASFAENFAIFKEEEQNYISIRDRFFASCSHNLAKDLKDGQPCPVCGSIHHPHLAEMSDPVSELDLKQAEAKYKRLEKNINEQKDLLTKSQSSYLAKLETVINLLKENGFDTVDEAFVFGDSIEQLYSSKKEEQLQLKKFAIHYDEMKLNVGKKSAKFEQQVSDTNERQAIAMDKLEKVNEQIKAKYSENTYVKSGEDFDNLSKTKIYVKNTQDIIDKYNSDVIRTKAIIDSTPKNLIEVGSVDTSTLVEETTQKNNKYISENDVLNRLTNKITNLSRSINSIKSKYDECKDIINRYASLSELAKVANGNNKMKLSFKMYILADYFDKIIVQANKRLYKITSGRYRLVRRNSVKGGGQQGLDLDVYDVETGKEREASSLSGGEKFVSALSMALGLSDIIETNHALIQVESIFIDEGFGSLDENYLDMAMKALESLKEDNKTIAIISHVEKLKEYIQDGIEVKKDTIGSKIVLKENI